MTPERFLEHSKIQFTTSGEWAKFHCINPTHPDSSPSMFMHLITGHVHCKGCGWKGFINDFSKLLNGQDYRPVQVNKPENIEIIRRPVGDPEIIIRGSFQDIREDPTVLKFANSIGITSNIFIDRYNIQFSSYTEAIAKHLIGTKREETRGWARFQNRLITPIYKKDKLINIDARCIASKEEREQLNIKKVLYVPGGSTQWIWGFDQWDLDGDIVITEGIKGASKIWNVNSNVGAIFRAIPSEEQLELLRQVRGTITVFANSDTSGLGLFHEGGILDDVQRGMIHHLGEKLGKPFKLCFDLRKHPDGKEYDESDCTLKEIETHLKRALWYEDYILKNHLIVKNYISTSKNSSSNTIVSKNVRTGASGIVRDNPSRNVKKLSIKNDPIVRKTADAMLDPVPKKR